MAGGFTCWLRLSVRNLIGDMKGNWFIFFRNDIGANFTPLLRKVFAIYIKNNKLSDLMHDGAETLVNRGSFC